MTAQQARMAVVRADRRVSEARTALSRATLAPHLRAMWLARLRRAQGDERRAYRAWYAAVDKRPVIARARALRTDGWALLAAWDRALDELNLPSRYHRGFRW